MKRPNLALLLGASFILYYFLRLAGEGVFAYFSGDDMENLHRYWTRPVWALLKANLLFFSTYYRPMGGVFYRMIFAFAGFHPMPFRIACYVLMTGNLYLAYCFCLRLTSSREIAGLAVLIGCYHARFWELYYSTGTVFDLLSFSFYYGAFLYYVKIRQSGAYPRGWKLAACCALYICALNSKEMAATLPACIAAYEWLYHQPFSHGRSAIPAWTLREGRALLLMGLITAIYVAGKLTGSEKLVRNDAYRPSISLRHYLDSLQIYTGKLFYAESWFDQRKAVALMLVLLILAWALKSSHLKLSWFIIIFGILPVAFIAHRGGYVLYIPMVGWALFGATLLVKARDLSLDLIRRVPIRMEQAMLFASVAVLLGSVHQSRHSNEWLSDPQNRIQSTVEQLRRLHPTLPRGSRILFLDDPFDSEDWELVFVLRLYYRDETLTVDTVKRLPVKLSGDEVASYDYVLTYEGPNIVQVKPAS